MKDRYKFIPEVFLFLIRDEKILLARRFQTGYEDGNYGLPAGHGEANETMSEGIRREALEEIGITIAAEEIIFAHTQHRFSEDNPHARVGFYFTATNYTGELHNAEPHKCDALDWFPLSDLPTNIVPHVRAAIESYLRGEKYSEYNWEHRMPFVS
jgi:ADP-ribose pyrophosphatase YjhB (NUDIX family)